MAVENADLSDLSPLVVLFRAPDDEFSGHRHEAYRNTKEFGEAQS